MSEISTYVYGAIVVFGAAWQLSVINIAMTTYDQAEIGPINETFCILMNLSCGALVMDESGNYTWLQMLFLFGCAMVCVLGIFIISNKPVMFSNFVDRLVFIIAKRKSQKKTVEIDNVSTEETLNSESVDEQLVLKKQDKKMFDRFCVNDQEQIKLVFEMLEFYESEKKRVEV